MKKILLLLSSTLISSSLLAQEIPDPTIEPSQDSKIQTKAPSMPNTPSEEQKEDLVVHGVITQSPGPLNVVIINDRYYKRGQIVGSYMVVFVSRQKVVLKNIKTKEIKTFNFTGDK